MKETKAEATALAETAQPPVIKLTKLSKAQLALLDVLQDPRVVDLDVTQICKLANITRATYYSAFKDKDFLATLETMVQELLVRNEPAIIHNVIAKAKDPGQKNQHWAAMVLKMRGRLEEKSQRPAQVIVHFGNIVRPVEKVIEVKAQDIVEGEDLHGNKSEL